jgi:acetolactate synthase-1/2/3 large subunit
MFMNNSFGVNKKLKNVYTHGEQGACYAAIGYAKASNKPVIVSTTAGVAAMNATAGLLVAWQESLPVLFISGQVNSRETIRTVGGVRHYSGQDCDVTESVKNITKYVVEINDPTEIKFHLDRIFYELENGRKGPCWLSVPLDIQNHDIDIDTLKGFTPDETASHSSSFSEFKKLLDVSKRPLIIAGNGIKLSDSCQLFEEFVTKFGIPFVTSYNGIDVMSSDSDLYIGRCGINGDRCGNFAIQNCDLLISMGCRLALGVVGYMHENFSRESKKIMIDIDEKELNKDVIHIDLKIHENLATFLNIEKPSEPSFKDWRNKCLSWKQKWFRQLPPKITEDLVNPYYFYHDLCEVLPDNSCLISSSGTIHTPMVHSFKNSKNVKFIMNSSTGDMGSELPGTLGIYLSGKFEKVIGIIGDGSFMFNIQELETIRHHKTNIKLIIMNNNGYESIRVSQRNYFGNCYGTDEQSGLSFPKFEDVAHTFGFNYHEYSTPNEIETVLNDEYAWIIEVKCHGQDRFPKLSSSKNAEGKIVSKPLEDMYPFLDRKEFHENMYVKPLDIL